MAKLRLLLVDRKYRGLGLASLLVDACLSFAREKGYRGVELWTHANLTAARGMYAKRGFAKVNEEPYRGLGGHALVAEEWEMFF
jgi:ribosomal protein S18 acetylase RimI-like enzyme